MDFSQVEAEFERLKAQFEAGALTEAEFKAQLEELMIQDKQGRWWMIGYETGEWYYHDGEKWVLGEPPQVEEIQRIEPGYHEMEALLLTTIGWGIGFAIGAAVGAVIGWAMGWAITGAIGGLSTGLALQWTQSSVQWKQALMVACGWVISLPIGWTIHVTLGAAIGWTTGLIIGWAIAGAIGGLITGLALQRIELSIQRKQAVILASGWVVGLTIGWYIGWLSAKTIGWGIAGAITGAIGGGMMFWQVSRIRRSSR